MAQCELDLYLSEHEGEFEEGESSQKRAREDSSESPLPKRLRSLVAEANEPGWEVVEGKLACRVPDCDGQSYSTDFGFRRHWKNIHCRTIDLLECPESEKCNALKTSARVKDHLISIHGYTDEHARESARSCGVIVRPNRFFINPGNYKPLAANVLTKSKEKVVTPIVAEEPAKESSRPKSPSGQRVLPNGRKELIELIEKARGKIKAWETIEAEAKEKLKRVEYCEVADKLQSLRDELAVEVEKNKELQDQLAREVSEREETSAKLAQMLKQQKAKNSAKVKELVSIFQRALEED